MWIDYIGDAPPARTPPADAAAGRGTGRGGRGTPLRVPDT